MKNYFVIITYIPKTISLFPLPDLREDKSHLSTNVINVIEQMAATFISAFFSMVILILCCFIALPFQVNCGFASS